LGGFFIKVGGEFQKESPKKKPCWGKRAPLVFGGVVKTKTGGKYRGGGFFWGGGKTLGHPSFGGEKKKTKTAQFLGGHPRRYIFIRGGTRGLKFFPRGGGAYFVYNTLGAKKRAPLSWGENGRPP